MTLFPAQPDGRFTTQSGSRLAAQPDSRLAGQPGSRPQQSGTGQAGYPQPPAYAPSLPPSQIQRILPVPGTARGFWWKVLLGGLGLWVLTVIVTVMTGNANLVPTLILVGSFLVPFSATLLAMQHTAGRINPARVLMAFFVGGIFGVLAASILEARFSGQGSALLGAGFIEEAVKLAVLAFAARQIVVRTPAVGAWLGAVVGAGFAAFESAGYALNSSLGHGGIDLLALLQTEAVRGLLAPAGHILWTAIIGAALFAVLGRADAKRAQASRDAALARVWNPTGGAAGVRGVAGVRPAITTTGMRPATNTGTRAVTGHAGWLPLFDTYIGVALLHTAWDVAGTIAQHIAVIITGVGRYQAEYGFTPQAAVAQAQTLSMGLYATGIAVITLIGATWLVTSVVRGRRMVLAASPATA